MKKEKFCSCDNKLKGYQVNNHQRRKENKCLQKKKKKT